jgi:hypothetical protein
MAAPGTLRAALLHSYLVALAKRLAISPDEVLKRIAFVWSGGTHGVLISRGTAGLRRIIQEPSAPPTIHVRSADRFPSVRILRN